MFCVLCVLIMTVFVSVFINKSNEQINMMPEFPGVGGCGDAALFSCVCYLGLDC